MRAKDEDKYIKETDPVMMGATLQINPTNSFSSELIDSAVARKQLDKYIEQLMMLKDYLSLQKNIASYTLTLIERYEHRHAKQFHVSTLHDLSPNSPQLPTNFPLSDCNPALVH